MGGKKGKINFWFWLLLGMFWGISALLIGNLLLTFNDIRYAPPWAKIIWFPSAILYYFVDYFRSVYGWDAYQRIEFVKAYINLLSPIYYAIITLCMGYIWTKIK
ncbi:MAG: hypothetical protein V1921_08985 [Candidatus Altiarchaeota archaeon]